MIVRGIMLLLRLLRLLLRLLRLRLLLLLLLRLLVLVWRSEPLQPQPRPVGRSFKRVDLDA